MDLKAFQGVAPGMQLWYVTGRFTASRVQVLRVVTRGAVSYAVCSVVDHAPTQEDAGQFNDGGLRLSYRLLEFGHADCPICATPVNAENYCATCGDYV